MQRSIQVKTCCTMNYVDWVCGMIWAWMLQDFRNHLPWGPCLHILHRRVFKNYNWLFWISKNSHSEDVWTIGLNYRIFSLWILQGRCLKRMFWAQSVRKNCSSFWATLRRWIFWLMPCRCLSVRSTNVTDVVGTGWYHCIILYRKIIQCLWNPWLLFTVVDVHVSEIVFGRFIGHMIEST